VKSFTSQFGNPTGTLGRLVGTIMAFENRERNAWAVSLLDVQPTDHLLEIGFGPGLAIQQMAALASNGLVAGVDQSAVMVQQASRRNAAGIRSGHIEVKQASADLLPYPNHSFDKAIAINSLHHWPDRQAGIREIKRVLKANGLLVLVEQPRTKATEVMLTDLSKQLMAQLVEGGFDDIKSVTKAMKPVATVAATARAYFGQP